jgi:DNA-directed RNA polymerase alpha subunit
MMRKDDIKALTTRLHNVARNEGIAVEVLIRLPEAELMRTPNMGRKTVALAKALLAAPAGDGSLWFWASQ